MRHRLCLVTLAALALLGACSDLHVSTVSPNDPAYNDTGAPGSPQFPISGPRPYKPLGSVGGGH